MLSAEEARVLGCLVEKQLATPQYYPLTLNSLLLACNQSSNRNPVVRYDDGVVEEALSGLREKGLAHVVHSPSNRAVKYRHVVDEAWGLDARESALVSVLLLRGAQTLGELRARTERLADFPDVAAVEHDLERLATRDDPLVVRLERQPGQKEARFATTLADITATATATAPDSLAGGAHLEELEQRVLQLEMEVAELRTLLD